MKEKKSFSVFTIFGKIVLVVFFPAYLAIILVFHLLGFLFDLIFCALDKEELDETSASTRKRDRFENRIKNLGNSLMDYLKLIVT